MTSWWRRRAKVAIAAVVAVGGAVAAFGTILDFGGDVIRLVSDKFSSDAAFRRELTDLCREHVGRISDTQLTSNRKLVTFARQRLDVQAAFAGRLEEFEAPGALKASVAQYHSSVAGLNRFGYDRIRDLTDRRAYRGQAFFETFFADTETTRALTKKAEVAAADMEVPACSNPALLWPVRG